MLKWFFVACGYFLSVSRNCYGETEHLSMLVCTSLVDVGLRTKTVCAGSYYLKQIMFQNNLRTQINK